MVFPSFILSCSLLCACGYHFRTIGEPIGITLDSIAIPLFPSSSSYLGYEGEFIRVVREEFITNSRVRIERKERAQAVLSGKIHSIITDPLTFSITQETIHGYSSTDVVTSSRTMKVRVEVKLTDRATGTILWQDSNVTSEASFSVSSDPLTNQYNQRQTFISIAQDIASQIYSRTMERF
jgi:outer membrane lipopolysaccharide assembly protein LptE/RlpB